MAATLPPPRAAAATDKNTGRPIVPKNVLRGHKTGVHACVFVRGNDRLVTGDSDGFVVVWDLTIMRPRAVWKAHEKVILGISGWGQDKIISHGRDHKIIVWRLREEDEPSMSTVLPLDKCPEPRPKPWILNIIEVNTMNFCMASLCVTSAFPPSPPDGPPLTSGEAILAVPETKESEAIDIYHLPSQRREHTVRLGGDNGMAMVISLFYMRSTLTIVAGYESGAVVVAQLLEEGEEVGDANNNNSNRKWVVQYRTVSHIQPVLGIDVSPDQTYFLTSSIDSRIGKHPLPGVEYKDTAFQDAYDDDDGDEDDDAKDDVAPNRQQRPSSETGSEASSSSGAAASAAAVEEGVEEVVSSAAAADLIKQSGIATRPLGIVDTGHKSQQSLRIRSDGRIFATAGWDSRVRVYRTDTLEQLSVLKWHAGACYALSFAAIVKQQKQQQQQQQQRAEEQKEKEGREKGDASGSGSGSSKPEIETQASASGKEEAGGSQQRQPLPTNKILVPRLVNMSLSEKRILHAKTAHWIAVGAKDGRVSLWEIF